MLQGGTFLCTAQHHNTNLILIHNFEWKMRGKKANTTKFLSYGRSMEYEKADDDDDGENEKICYKFKWN